jgi:hypothetical protein
MFAYLSMVLIHNGHRFVSNKFKRLIARLFQRDGLFKLF